MIDLKRFRDDKNLTQSDIIKVLGISQSMVSKIESTGNISDKHYRILKNEFGEIVEQYKSDNPILDKTKNQNDMYVYDLLLKEKDLRIQELKEEVAVYRELLTGKTEPLNKQTGS